MPKTSDTGGASYMGQQGIVQAATGRLDEVDPSLNLDGSLKDGFESDERPDLTERDEDDFEPRTVTHADDDIRLQDDPERQPVPSSEEEKTAAQDQKVEQGDSSQKEEAKPSVGNSSRTTDAKSAPSASKRK